MKMPPQTTSTMCLVLKSDAPDAINVPSTKCAEITGSNFCQGTGAANALCRAAFGTGEDAPNVCCECRAGSINIPSAQQITCLMCR